MSIVLAVDPGTTQSAFLLMGNDWEILDKGKVFNEELRPIVAEYGYNIMVIEGFQSFGMSVGHTVFQTAYFIGRLLEIAESTEHETLMVYRQDIKLHHCHTCKAKDANLRQALVDRFGDPGTKKNPGKLYGISKDVWSALAIATYWHDTH